MRPLPLYGLGLMLMCAGRAGAGSDYPIRPVPFHQVQPTGGFWADRFETNRKVTVPYDFEKCEETGRIDNFAVAGGLKEGSFQGIPFNDSDVFKVIEGAAYTLAMHPDPALDRYLDDLIAKIVAAQEDDGYLYSARTSGRVDGFTGPERWSNLRTNHELYNVGHMYEAAAAHFEATGKRAFLDVALRNADLICRVFGYGDEQLKDIPGHQQIEMGLARLYRVTGQQKYLDQARFFLDLRGRKDLREKVYGAYCQDHVPVLEQREAVGHAVRANYMYSGMADVAALTGDRAYIEAIDGLWQDVVDGKMYITGGVAARRHGEAYGDAFELPHNAYNETCASIAFGMWNHRMFLLHGEAGYMDLVERVLYNGFLSGISLSGDRFFYPNPLVSDGIKRFNQGQNERAPWFGCSCCPVNVVRYIPMMAGYVFAVRGDDIYVNLYGDWDGRVQTGDRTVRLVQQSEYPWKGEVQLTVTPDTPGPFTLKLRIPGWVQGKPAPGSLYQYLPGKKTPFTVMVNGESVSQSMEAGYLTISRAWNAGDRVDIDFPMPVRRVRCDKRVEANRGRVSVERGPVVYCAEGADHEDGVLHLWLPDEADLQPEHRETLLGGVTVLTGTGQAAIRRDGGQLASEETPLTLIPYYAWCHRGANEMLTWLPRTLEAARPRTPPTLTSRSRVSASHCYGQDAVRALNDLQEPVNSIDHDIPRLTFWPHRGTSEWVQVELPQSTAVSGVEVYWFDDTGRGQCRVPKSWSVAYQKDGTWMEMPGATAAGIEPDTYNRVTFPPIHTDVLRLNIVLQDDFSGGILEGRVLHDARP